MHVCKHRQTHTQLLRHALSTRRQSNPPGIIIDASSSLTDPKKKKKYGDEGCHKKRRLLRLSLMGRNTSHKNVCVFVCVCERGWLQMSRSSSRRSIILAAVMRRSQRSHDECRRSSLRLTLSFFFFFPGVVKPMVEPSADIADS